MKERLKIWFKRIVSLYKRKRFYKSECKALKWQVKYDELNARLAKAQYEKIQDSIKYAMIMQEFKKNDSKKEDEKPKRYANAQFKKQRNR